MAKEEVIGSPRRNLVLQTTGGIRVKVGDKYYRIKYSEEDEEDDESKDKDKSSNWIFTEHIADYENGVLEYPGDDVLIFATNDGIYYTKDNSYLPFGVEEPNGTNNPQEIVFDSTVSFKGTPPFKVIGPNLVENLNADKLDGYDSKAFVLKSELTGFGGSLNVGGSDKVPGVSDVTLPENITCETLTTKNLVFDNLINPIKLQNTIIINSCEQLYIVNFSKYGANYMEMIGTLLLDGAITNLDGSAITTDYLEFLKKLLKPYDACNLSVNILDGYLPEMVDPETNTVSDELKQNYIKSLIELNHIWWEPIISGPWYDYKINGISGYEWMKRYCYTGDMSEYTGGLFKCSSINTNIKVGTVIDDIPVSDPTNHTEDNPEAINTTTTGIITCKDNEAIYILTKYPTRALNDADMKKYVITDNVEKIFQVENPDGEPFSLTFTYTKYEVKELGSNEHFDDVEINLQDLSETGTSVIGNLNDVVDYNFDNMAGNGIYINNNLYANNPSIIWSCGIEKAIELTDTKQVFNLDHIVFTYKGKQGHIEISDTGELKFKENTDGETNTE